MRCRVQAVQAVVVERRATLLAGESSTTRPRLGCTTDTLTQLASTPSGVAPLRLPFGPVSAGPARARYPPGAARYAGPGVEWVR